MASNLPGPRVISGEASESDDDDQAPPSSVTILSSQVSSQGVISGEDSESDDDSTEMKSRVDILPPLQVNEKSPSSPKPTNTGKPRRTKKVVKPSSPFNSLLHVKLREKNSSFHNNLEQFTAHSYSSSAKELLNISAQLAKSQEAVQDISHNMRLLTNDLFYLEDKIDIIASCNILPTIKMPETS